MLCAQLVDWLYEPAIFQGMHILSVWLNCRRTNKKKTRPLFDHAPIAIASTSSLQENMKIFDISNTSVKYRKKTHFFELS